MRTIVFYLSMILIFMIPFERTLRLDESNTFTKLIGLAVAGLWAATALITGRIRTPQPIHVLLLLFALWVTFSLAWTIDFNATLSRTLTYIQGIGLVYIIWDLFRTPARIRAALQAYALGCHVVIVSTLINYATGHSSGQSFHTRYGASGFDGNDTSLIIALGLPIVWYLITVEPKGPVRFARWLKLANYVYLPLGMFAILLTASRAGVFVACLSFPYMLATFSRLGLMTRILFFLALIVALISVQPLVPKSSLNRLAEGASEFSEGNLGNRQGIWISAFELFLQHPIIGVGSNAFRRAHAHANSPHNTYLAVLVELGLVGFILFSSVLVLAARYALKHPKTEARLWATLLLVWAVGNCSMTWGYRKPTMLIIGLTVGSACVRRQFPLRSRAAFRVPQTDVRNPYPAPPNRALST